MRRVLGVLFLVALAVRPAAAGRMLIATAATEGGLDRFCLNRDGTFVSGDTRPTIFLKEKNPRRMIFVAEDRPGNPDAGTLYVATQNLVEVFRFGLDGNVARHCGTSGTDSCRGRTEFITGMEPRGLAVDPTTRTLYVASYGLGRVAAYPLDDNGLPPDPDLGTPTFTSCVQGNLGSGYADVTVDGGRVYVAAEAGRIDVFGTLAGGRLCSCAPCLPEGDGDCRHKESCAAGDPCLPTTAAECDLEQNDDTTTPLLQRRKLVGPTHVFVADGTTLVVQEAPAHRLVAFTIADLQPVTPRICKSGTNVGLPCNQATEADACPDSFCFTPKVCVGGPNIGKACKPKTEDADCLGSNCGDVAPKRASRSVSFERYNQMIKIADTGTFMGSQFFIGRLDAFRLKPPGKKNCFLDACPAGEICCLPRQPTSLSEEDLRMSPVGLDVVSVQDLGGSGDGYVLYVGAGADDRVRAYRLGPTGLFRTKEAIAETNERGGSYPNAVAVVPSDSCP